LKPWRWVAAFLMLIPEDAPSLSGLRRRLATGVRRRVVPRTVDVLRPGPVFLVRRVTAAVFLDR
jgi:hypothetical protein